MQRKFRNLKQLITYFSDEKVALAYLEEELWGGKPTCPHCGHQNPRRLEDGINFKCRGKKPDGKKCDSRFNVKVGTIYENTKLPLSTWFASIYLCTGHKKGISSCQLGRDLGITQKTAWFVLHRIREMAKIGKKRKLKDVVQADECFIGGSNKNRHADKKIESAAGRSRNDKTIVLGIMQQDGVVRTEVIPDAKAKTIKPIIQRLVEKGAILITDDWDSYKSLKKEYFHVVVDHSQGEYVRGAFSTNRMEGFWGLLNRGLYGIYHQVSPKHLQRYLEEFSHRYNSRKLNDADRFVITVQQSRGRLTYADLTKKIVPYSHEESQQENEEKGPETGKTD